MTTLKPEMIAALWAVTVEKTKYDVLRDELEAQHELNLTHARAALTNAVRYARDIGTPIRQIGIQGLSTKDAATVKAILGESEAPVLIPDEVKQVLTKPGITELDGNIYIVTEPSGDEWEFWALDLDGILFFERSNYTDRGVDSDTPTPANVVATLTTTYPKGDFTSLLDEED